MATTTNYGWDTPDDTDLVKDGAAAIRTLGSSVDTTTKALNPSTTLGDIEYRSATANTNTRLALGTAGQVLQVNSGATAPEWVTPAAGGGMTLLSTTTLSGASVTISGISQSYKSLVGYIRLPLPANDGAALRLRPNNVSTTSYFNQFAAVGVTGQAADATEVRYAPNSDNGTTNAFITFEIFDYADTTHYKMISALALTNNQTTPATEINIRNTVAYLYDNSAISSLVVFFDSGNMTSGTLLLYGVS
jgi:hypothetical protein